MLSSSVVSATQLLKFGIYLARSPKPRTMYCHRQAGGGDWAGEPLPRYYWMTKKSDWELCPRPSMTQNCENAKKYVSEEMSWTFSRRQDKIRYWRPHLSLKYKTQNKVPPNKRHRWGKKEGRKFSHKAAVFSQLVWPSCKIDWWAPYIAAQFVCSPARTLTCSSFFILYKAGKKVGGFCISVQINWQKNCVNLDN